MNLFTAFGVVSYLSCIGVWGDNLTSNPSPPFVDEEGVSLTPGEPNDDELDDASFTDDLEVDPSLDDPIPPLPRDVVGDDLLIDLKNPSFVHGVMITEEGGVISSTGLRIQARKIAYTNRIENGIRVQKIVAEGDLLMEYAGRAFVGSKLEFDFNKKVGTLWDGKTFVDIWFLGGDRIELKEDGTFYIFNAFVTTCESQDNTWEIHAKKMKISDDHLLAARNIRLRFLKVPLLWLPSFKSNLKMLADSPIRYKLVWDKGLGPRVTMRYRVFSWNDLNLFFRLDYRIRRGFGGALESEYFSPDGATTFVTRSYGAYDKTFPDEKGPHRYRLQGLYHTESKDENTQVHLTWDKLGDTRMVGDFRSDDFEINTQKRTKLMIYHRMNDAFVNFNVQPRINRFQSIDQELPLFSMGIRPFAIGRSGIMMRNDFNAGYLDYVYATDLRNQLRLRDLPSSTHSIRVETRNSFYRPFSLGRATFTPNVGIIGIFYSNSPAHHPVGQGIFHYGFQGNTRLSYRSAKLIHTVEPYLHFQGLTSPTVPLSHHYYFDMNDGYDQLNQLRLGVRSLLYTHKSPSFSPSLVADLYTNLFFGHRAFANTAPKSYFCLQWNRPFFSLKGNVAWNFEEQLWDFANVAAEWTVNEDFAFAAEFRHRSRFDWRKANHENFIVDVARSISELLHSPLSDGRDTFLARAFFRLSPKWSCQVQSRHGWGRKNEPRYNAGKVDLFTMLSCSWRLRLSYERMPNDNRFSGAVSLVK